MGSWWCCQAQEVWLHLCWVQSCDWVWGNSLWKCTLYPSNSVWRHYCQWVKPYRNKIGQRRCCFCNIGASGLWNRLTQTWHQEPSWFEASMLDRAKYPKEELVFVTQKWLHFQKNSLLVSHWFCCFQAKTCVAIYDLFLFASKASPQLKRCHRTISSQWVSIFWWKHSVITFLGSTHQIFGYTWPDLSFQYETAPSSSGDQSHCS